MANSQEATIALIAECCAHIEAMCADLDEAGWHRPTSLPGWDVQDVVAHLGSLDGMLLGRSEPPHRAANTAHVRNPLGEMNEGFVDRRRQWSGAEVLDEFREMTSLRLEQLRDLDEAALDSEVPAPTGGTMPQRAFLGFRLWDFLVHEMDIAEALGLVSPVETTAGTRVLDELLLLFPRAVAKARTAEGATVELTVSEPLQRSLAVTVRDGRAAPTESSAAGEAALHLRASPAALLRVGTGRQAPDDAITTGVISVEGDVQLAGRVLAALNVVP